MTAPGAMDTLEVAGSLLLSLSDAYLLTDLDGEVLAANAAARRLLTGSDVGEPPPVTRWSNDTERTAELLDRWRLSTSPRPATFALASGREVRGDGARVRTCDWLLIRLRDRDRSVASYAGVASKLRGDHLHALSQRLDATVAQLHDANRQLEFANEELQQYAAAVAHDVRTPLFTIRGFTQMLLEGHHVDETGRELVELVLASAERLHQTTESLLAVARLDQASPGAEPVALAKALHEALDDLSRELAETQAVVDSDGLADLHVAVPTVSLRQVFQNLVTNSLRFRAPDREPRIEVGARRIGDLVEVAVSDNGLGVDDEDREHLFDLFQRGTRRDTTPGHGIGLATCRKLVNRWGGSIRCEAQSEPGARFVFTAPYVEPSPVNSSG